MRELGVPTLPVLLLSAMIAPISERIHRCLYSNAFSSSTLCYLPKNFGGNPPRLGRHASCRPTIPVRGHGSICRSIGTSATAEWSPNADSLWLLWGGLLCASRDVLASCQLPQCPNKFSCVSLVQYLEGQSIRIMLSRTVRKKPGLWGNDCSSNMSQRA